MNIRFIGDHSNYHCGSAAAADVIKGELERNGHLVTTDDYDMLVVNGEGSMHHNSAGFRKKMAEIITALDTRRPVYLINTVWQDNPQQAAELIKGCEQVIVREVLSARELKASGVTTTAMPDQCYFANIDNVEYVDFGGAVVFTDFWSSEFGCFVRLNSKSAQKFRYIDMQAMTWSQLVRSLRTASLLVTGRHHAVYAACKAEIPFLAKQGNTHKIEGLIETAGADIPVFDSFDRLKRRLKDGPANRASYDALFDWLERQPSWSLAH